MTVLTGLEAHAPADRVDDLRRAYRAAAEDDRPPFILRSYLVRGGEPEVWRIMTGFRTAEDLAAMRASGETPKGCAHLPRRGC